MDLDLNLDGYHLDLDLYPEYRTNADSEISYIYGPHLTMSNISPMPFTFSKASSVDFK